MLDRDDWTANTDNLVVANPASRRLTWVPRDLWCESLSDRINTAYRAGGPQLLAAALREHGLATDGSLVLRRRATERLLADVAVTVPVPRPLEFLYPLTPTSQLEDGSKLIRFEPPTERLAGERIHQWLGARRVPGGVGSDLQRIARQQVAVRAVLRAGTPLSSIVADPTLVRVEGESVIETLRQIDETWELCTVDDVVSATVDGKAVLKRDRGPLRLARASRRRLRRRTERPW